MTPASITTPCLTAKPDLGQIKPANELGIANDIPVLIVTISFGNIVFG